MKIDCRILLTAILLACLMEGNAQQARETFGTNRIQYKLLDWSFVSADNFDVYYYGDRAKQARATAEYLEKEFVRITGLLGSSPLEKTKIFLYNSSTDLQQSNVKLNRLQFLPGGETKFIKPYVEVASPGNTDEFKEELSYKVSDLLVNEMMFGGTLREMFKSSAFLNLPSWFLDGAAYYAAKGWSEEMDDYVRQLLKAGKAKKALHFTGRAGALVGQSIFNYIAEKYGVAAINNILNYSRIIRKVERGIQISLGVPFKQVIAGWQEFYGTEAKALQNTYTPPLDSQQFIRNNSTNIAFTAIDISPDGQYLAYAKNDRGRFTVFVRSVESRKDIKILDGGLHSIDPDLDYRMPVLRWSNASTLGVIIQEKGNYAFLLYDLKTRGKQSRSLARFSNIRNLAFSGSGSLVVLSADAEGQNDLYLMSTRRDLIRRLTKDAFDDLDPVFVPGTNTIIFSSNRHADSLAGKDPPMEKLSNQFNLFSYNLDSIGRGITQLTRTVSRDFHPVAVDQKNIVYLSDQRGIVNLFKFNTDTKIYTQLTNFDIGIKDFDYVADANLLAMVTTRKLKDQVFLYKGYSEKQVFTPPTKRRESFQLKKLAEKRKQTSDKTPASIKEIVNQRLKKSQDSLATKATSPRTPLPPGAIDTDNYSFEEAPPVSAQDSSAVAAKSPPKTPPSVNVDNYSFEDAPPVSAQDSSATAVKPPPKTSSVINTDNYAFEDEPKKAPEAPVPKNQETAKRNPSNDVQSSGIDTDNYKFEEKKDTVRRKSGDTFLERLEKTRKKQSVSGPYVYKPLFTSDNLIPSLGIDPLRGLMQRIEIQMNDLLESYRFFGGLQFRWGDILNSGLSGDAFAEFQYLPHRVDYGIRFDRKVYYWNTKAKSADTDRNGKYSYQKLEFTASLPITVHTRISVKPFATFTHFAHQGLVKQITGVPDFWQPQTQWYGGGKIEAVFDNSITTGLNITEGTRGKLSLINYQAVGNSAKSFSQFTVDLRHYQKIYKEITIAFRGVVGKFFGNSPKNYILGGVDTWAWPKFNTSGYNNPIVNPTGKYNEQLLFIEVASNLRGFDLATLYGNNVLLGNAELRLPIFRALSSGPVSSNFFKNFQVIGFYDVGTSWSGAPPFNSEQSVRTRVVPENGSTTPFKIVINEFSNPWLYSYGAGVRSVVLNHFMWLNVAWPVENYRTLPPRVSFGIGLDF